MHEWFSDFAKWGWLMISGWRQYAEAGSTALIWVLVEKWRKQPISWRLLLYVAIAFFVFACFNVWRDQYKARTSAEQEKDNLKAELTKQKVESEPNLIGEILVIEIAPWPGNSSNSIVIVDASIKNLGAPTVVDHFIVKVKLGGRLIQGLQIPAPSEGIIARHPGGGESIHHAADYLPRKGLQTISKYGATEGFYSVMIPNVSVEELTAGQAVVVLSYKDATGKSYEIEKAAAGKSYMVFPPSSEKPPR